MMSLEEALAENTILRGLLPALKLPCAYCGLTEIAKCPRGFPGCALADDILCAGDETLKRLLEENRKVREAVKPLVEALEKIAYLPPTPGQDDSLLMMEYAKEGLKSAKQKGWR